MIKTALQTRRLKRGIAGRMEACNDFLSLIWPVFCNNYHSVANYEGSLCEQPRLTAASAARVRDQQIGL